MAPSFKSRLRMTAWPGPVPPVSTLHHLGPYRLDGDILRLDLAEVGFPEVDVPDELYLRELHEVDLDDPKAIETFTNTYGRLGHSTVSRQLRTDQTPAVDRQMIGLFDYKPFDESALPWQEWFDDIDQSDDLDIFGVMEVRMITELGMQHVDTFRAWAQAFRGIADIVDRDMRGSASPDELTEVRVILDSLLEPFHPSITGPDEMLSDDYTPFNPFTDRMPRLENILALQIFNHLAAGDVYRTCANETCRRRFVHQRGRSVSGKQKGIGVVYCSHTCSNSQASREYRRRKRAEKNQARKETTDGLD
jgi:hypothetical protein